MRATRRALLGLPFAAAAVQAAEPPPRLLVALDAAVDLPAPPGLAAIQGVEVTRATVSAVQVAFARSVREGRPMADLVLTSLRGFVRGTAAELWGEWAPGVVPAPATPLERAAALPGAALLEVGPGGPFLAHRSGDIPRVPATPRALLDFARQTRGFTYQPPDASPVGEIFLAALPHLLGEEQPGQPRAWTRTWEWLREMERHIPWRPASPEAAIEGFNAGELRLMPVTPPAFAAARAAGAPADAALSPLPGAPLMPLGLVLALPRGLRPDRRAAVRTAGDALRAALVVAPRPAPDPALLRGRPTPLPGPAALLDMQALWARRIGSA